MKIVAVLILSIIAVSTAGPISVSNNNVGDIVSVGVNANLEISSEINQNIISIIVALLNQELGIINIPNGPRAPNLPNINISPELIERIREILGRE